MNPDASPQLAAMAMMFANKYEKDGHLAETVGLQQTAPEELKEGEVQNTPLFYIELIVKILTNPPSIKFDPANENSVKASEAYVANMEKAIKFL